MSVFGKVWNLFHSRSSLNFEDYHDVEDVLIEADFGPQFAASFIDILKKEKPKDRTELKQFLKKHIISVLLPPPELNVGFPPHLFLFVGVNGSGKTTSIAKIAQYFQSKEKEKSILIAAGDTFRSAAVDQLNVLFHKKDIRVLSQNRHADPAAVIVDAIDSARSQSNDIIIADTAGRIQTHHNLMQELKKIDRVITQRLSAYTKILVLDSTLGQNALEQTRIFHDAVGIDLIILSKYDAHGGGGFLVPIAQKFRIGCSFLGTGEKPDSLQGFDPATFAENLLL